MALKTLFLLSGLLLGLVGLTLYAVFYRARPLFRWAGPWVLFGLLALGLGAVAGALALGAGVGLSAPPDWWLGLWLSGVLGTPVLMGLMLLGAALWNGLD